MGPRWEGREGCHGWRGLVTCERAGGGTAHCSGVEVVGRVEDGGKRGGMERGRRGELRVWKYGGRKC